MQLAQRYDEAADLILDGEIVPIQGERILPFQELQKRLGRKKFQTNYLPLFLSLSSPTMCCMLSGAC
jgi:ATP-dependent DNA ligase